MKYFIAVFISIVGLTSCAKSEPIPECELICEYPPYLIEHNKLDDTYRVMPNKSYIRYNKDGGIVEYCAPNGNDITCWFNENKTRTFVVKNTELPEQKNNQIKFK